MTSNASSSPPAPIDGHWDPRFAPVREAFGANFVEEDEIGAALCVRVGGSCVVDVWGGHMDAKRTRPWCRDTLVNAYSVGKGVLAVLVLGLVDEGRIELDARVAELWPEFAAKGKRGMTVRQLLAHQGGLPAVRERLAADAMYDWDTMCTALAAQAPYWEPGNAHGYHVNTYGFLVGELVRRACRLDVGTALAERVAGPLEAEFYYGLPRSEHQRVAELVAFDRQLSDETQWAMAFPPTGDAEHDRMIWHAYFNPPGLSGMGMVNTEAWRMAVIPSTNGHATARAVAAVYAAFLDGGPNLSNGSKRARGNAANAEGWPGAGLRAEATAIHSDGEDRVLGRPSRFGLGFQLTQPTRPLGPNPGAFGHCGYGGSLGFADPEAQVVFGYLMNRPGDRWQTPRTQRLVDALYTCL